MSGILQAVDERTQMAGANRLELLLFRLDGEQIFGINVFKVQEVVCCPPLNQLPGARPAVRGLAVLRGQPITVIDLAQAIGSAPVADPTRGFIIITEYNRSTQGFLVSHVDRIINLKWEEIKPPPQGAAQGGYLTAVTSHEGSFVEIIDVEKVLEETVAHNDGMAVDIQMDAGAELDAHVLIADDSSVARKQIANTLKAIGAQCTCVNTGAEALRLLQQWVDEDPVTFGKLGLIVSDIEMPEMDGYTLTRRIRENPKLRHLKIVLHSSLTGIFNENLVKQVGADDFISKFDPESLAHTVQRFLNSSSVA